MGPAMSSGTPSLPAGRAADMASSRPSYNASAKRVLTTPGAIALTRTAGPTSTANSCVSRITRALVAPYQPIPGDGASPAMEAMLTTAPPRPPSPEWYTFWVHARVPSVLTSAILRAADRSRSTVRPKTGLIPVLFTRKSTGPNSDSARSTVSR